MKYSNTLELLKRSMKMWRWKSHTLLVGMKDDLEVSHADKHTGSTLLNNSTSWHLLKKKKRKFSQKRLVHKSFICNSFILTRRLRLILNVNGYQ